MRSVWTGIVAIPGIPGGPVAEGYDEVWRWVAAILTESGKRPMFQAVGGERLLLRDDLDELSDAAYEADDAAASAAEIASLATGGRLADPADVAYAYQLAAEIYERVDELEHALAMAERCLAAYRERREAEPGSIRAFRAELLLRIGREDEAMAELTSLRPAMTTSALAAAYIPEALAAGGRADTATEWLIAALAELGSRDDDDPVLAQLLATRERLAEAPGGGPEDVAEEDLSPAEDDSPDLGWDDVPYLSSEAVVLVWPREQYELVDDRWPEVLEATGATDWDDYRRRHQALVAGWAEQSRAPLWQVTGTADGFAEFLRERDVDQDTADLVVLAEEYGTYLAEQDDALLLPPGRGDPCWCGSGASYEACCLPLSPGHHR
jgi:tetratricopeptide (TPR) repeat protein